MPLPRPGKTPVQRVPEGAVIGGETDSALDAAEAAEEAAIPPLTLPGEAPAEMQLTMPPVPNTPATAQINPMMQGAGAESAPPWETMEGVPATVDIVDPPVQEERAAPIAQAQPMMAPAVAPAMPSITQVAPTQGGNIVSRGSLAQLAEMGYEGLNIGFGSFPVVVLKEDRFSTSDGDQLGNTFPCVIHGTRKKMICKSSDSQSAEFKYSYDGVNDVSGRPLQATYDIWRAQGIMTGEPIVKDYLDVTAQLFVTQSKELGAVVLLSVPQTSIARLSGYLTALIVAEGLQPNQVITQVYAAPKVTGVKYPFHPWGFRKWLTLDKVGL